MPSIYPYKGKHSGSHGFVGSNPNFSVVSDLRDADFVWYHTTGDSPKIQQDLDDIGRLGKPCIALLTGDHAPVRLPQGYIFGTCCGITIPYEYHSLIPEYLRLENNNKREIFASFRGSKRTWDARAKMEHPEVALTWTDWWGTRDRARMREEYIRELRDSVFSLCPRGNGRSTMRLFESILLGAIPVRLNDDTRPFRQDLAFSPKFDLHTTRMSDIIQSLRDIPESRIAEMRQQMRDFAEEFLVIDYRKGCEGTIGFTEWIREKLVKQ